MDIENMISIENELICPDCGGDLDPYNTDEIELGENNAGHYNVDVWCPKCNYHARAYIRFDYTITDAYLERSGKKLCKCYEECKRKENRYDVYTGRVAYQEEVTYGVCRGTRECDECYCEGNELKCTFYPEKRR